MTEVSGISLEVTSAPAPLAEEGLENADVNPKPFL